MFTIYCNLYLDIYSQPNDKNITNINGISIMHMRILIDEKLQHNNNNQ